jgi:hypothetical protein
MRNGNENSPVSSLPPIVNLPDGSQAATFSVPANDLDGDILTYRLATNAELIGSQPPGMSINSQTGEISVNTSLSNYTNGQLWYSGVVISDGQSSVLIDFLMSITQPSTAPTFIYPPTPADGTVYQLSPGQNINFQVSAQDIDPGGSIATLFATGLPGGASFNNSSGNPATSTFNWTPGVNDFGTYVLNFIAQDNVGVQASSSVSLQVSLKPQFDVPPTPAAGAHNTVVTPGTQIQYTVQASDPDPADVVQITMVEGKSHMGAKIPIYTGATFSPLPSVAANPTSGTFTWTPTQAQWGHRHVYFTATDSYGDQTVHEVSQLVNTPPVFSSTPVLTADVGQPYSYTVSVSDPDLPFGDELSIYGNALPGWLSLVDNGDGTATLSGTPSVADVGIVSINIQADDKHHHDDLRGTIYQTFDLTVNNCTVNALTQDATVYLNASGVATLLAADVDNGSSASCGVASLTVSPTSFSCSNLDTLLPCGGTAYSYNGVDEYGDASANAWFPDDQVDDYTLEAWVNPNDANTLSGIIDYAWTVNTSEPHCGFWISNGQFNARVRSDNGVSGYFVNLYGGTVQVNQWQHVAFTKSGSKYSLYVDGVEVASTVATISPSWTFTGRSKLLIGSTWNSQTVQGPMNGKIDEARIWSIGKTAAQIKTDMARCVSPQSTGLEHYYKFNSGTGSTVIDETGTSDAVVMNSNATWTTGAPVFTRVVNESTLTVTDVNGNTSTSVSSITVLDTLAPTMSSNTLTVNLIDRNGYTLSQAEINQLGANSSDNCSVAFSITSGQTNYNCAEVGQSLTLILTGTDPSGNSASVPVTVNVTDDNSVCNDPPIAVCQNLTLAVDNSCSVTISTLDVDGGSTDPDGDPLTYAIDNQGPFTLGNHTVTLTVSDGEYTDTCTAIVTVVDNIAPTAIAQGITVQLDANGQASITAQDIDNGSTDNCGAVNLSIDQMSFDCSNLGANTVTLTVSDNNGNANSATAIVTVEDKIAPAFICPANIVVSAKPGFCHTDVPVVFTPPTDNCANPSLTLSTSAGVIPQFGANSAIGTFPVGTTMVTAVVDDGNGNSISCQFNVTVNDTTAPTVNTQNLTLQLDASGQASITAQDIDNGSNDACGIASISVSKTAFSCADVGVNSLELTVTDIHGNAATGAATVTIEDNISPTAIAQSLTLYLDANGQASISAGDVDNGSSDNCGVSSLSLSQNTFGCNETGVNSIILTVTDLNGNQSTAASTVSILDTTAPVISCASDIIVSNDAGNCGAVVNYNTPTGNDNCSATVSQTAGLASGALYPVGVTTNTFIVTDASGNTSTCSFTVTVNDDEMPAAVCQDITLSLDQNGMATITASDIDGGSSDNCGVASISASQTQFGCNDVGDVLVNLDVVDVHGNISTCIATVTIEEGNFLELSSIADINANCTFHLGGAKVHWAEPSVKSFSSCSTDTCIIQKDIAGFTYLGERDGHRYYRSDSKNYTWFQAQAAAQAAGGQLAVINSYGENHYIACRLSRGRAWIGLTDETTEGQFGWVDGSALSYTKWKRNEPNNKGGKRCNPNNGADYGAIKRWSGKWEDRKGCERNEFIMEVTCGSSVQIQQIAGPSSGSVFTSLSTTAITYVATDSLTGATDTMSFDVVVDECVPVYCSAKGNCSSYEWIESVSIGGMTHTSGNDNGYGDHTNQTVHTNVGQSINLSLTPGYSNKAYTEYWTVYVDWNRDGDFCDWGERVDYACGKNTKTGSFTVPQWAASGDLRVRIVMRWGWYGSHCSHFSYGEVEDYTLVVDDAGQMAAKVAITQPSGLDKPLETGMNSGMEMIDLYPSPVANGGDVNVLIRSAEIKQITIQIIDLSGKVVHMQDVSLMEGENKTQLSTNQLAPGVYVVSLIGSAQRPIKFAVE